MTVQPFPATMNFPPADPHATPDDALQGAALGGEPVLVRPGERITLPLVRETLEHATVRHDNGAVRVRKELRERTETVQLQGWAQQAQVERVAIDQPADAVLPPRQEGDAWVVPVYEERWVVVKQLFLREELHVRAVRQPQERQESVVLRSEQVVIERADPVSGQWRAATDDKLQALALRPGASAGTSLRDP